MINYLLKFLTLLLFTQLFATCQKEEASQLHPVTVAPDVAEITGTSIIILGNVQDGGSPHIACTKNCCRDLFQTPDVNRKVVSLGVIDAQQRQTFLFEATPDLPVQMKNLKSHAPFSDTEPPDGIFLTHAHIGHYTGLMYLGKEAMGANAVPVYAMPRLKAFLETNGPWSQLVQNGNIALAELRHNTAIQLTENVQVTPFTVPHRDEYSETVGYTIAGPNKTALFIPDIDKWEKWETDIVEAVALVDYAFIDATFYDGAEINHRDISEIPHPFVIESMAKFEHLPRAEKNKVYFIHFNHTNPLLNADSEQSRLVIQKGYNIARMNDVFEL